MEIQKQKNLYLAKLLEQEVIKQDEFEDLVFKLEINAFHSNYLSSRFMDNINFGWSAWQAAKAHEAEKLKGCVLVPVQCPDPDFADSLFDELSKKAIGEFGDDLLIHFSDIDEEKIWALMVEAAKAQAAPEGFILVDKHQLAQLMANMDSFGKKALGDDYVSFADIAAVLDEAQEPAND